MIKLIIVTLTTLLLYSGCGGSSEPKSSINEPPEGKKEQPDSGDNLKSTKSIYSFIIHTKSGAEAEANAAAGINNFHLTIQRDSQTLFDSNVDNSQYSARANQDNSITISSKESLKAGDVLTLNADGFTPQQQSLDAAMLEANSMRVSLKPISSRQVFELGELNSGRVTTRFAMGASTKVIGENIEFKTNDNSVLLNIKKTQIERIAKRVKRSTKADKNTQIYLDITTIDPKTEFESAIGDFTYNPSKEPRSSKNRSLNQNDTMLESVVMASISMTTSEGDEIHCFDGSDYDENSGECSGDGSSATLKMKIPSSQFAQYADKYNKGERTIPLYHYSQAQATWIRQVKDGVGVDGELVLEDLNTNGSADEGDTLYLSGSVGHFSYWNGDTPREVVRLNGSVKVESGADLPTGTVVVSKGADYTGRSFRVPVSSELTYTNLGAKDNAKVELYLQYPDGSRSESIFVQTLSDNKSVGEVLMCDYEMQEVTLRVTDLEGNPLDGAVVQGAGSSSSTDKDGNVHVEISKNSATKITASYDTGTFVSSSSKFISGDDLTIVLDTRSFKISGNISFIDENGDALDFQNGYVDIYDYASGLYNRVDVQNSTFELLLPFNKVQSGKTLTIRAGIFVPLYAKYIDKEQTITLSDADMSAKEKSTNFAFTLQPFIVSGKVINPFAASGENGIPNITIYSNSQSVQSDENGNYKMLLFYKDGGQKLRAYDPVNADIVRPDVINIDESEQDIDHDNKNFVIDRRSAKIEGSVINEKGIPVQGVLVYTSYGWLSSVTDSEGKFVFEINDASMMGRSNIRLNVYDANDNTKLLGTGNIQGEIKRGETISAGEIAIDTNIAPIIRSVRWDEPILNQPMNIYVDAYDPDNNILQTTITYEGSVVDVVQGIATITPQNKGRVTFTTTVEESDGNLRAQLQQSLIVSENAKPVINDITGFVREYAKAANMVIDIDAQDPEGAELSFRAKLYDYYGRESSLISLNNSQVIIENSIPNGTYRLSIYISDGIDEIERTFSFSADDNVAPTNLTILKGEEVITHTVYAKISDGEFNLMANATDDNGDSLTYTWSYNEALGTVSENTLTIDPAGKVGIFPISVSVTDGRIYISKEITLVIENDLKPIINAITLNPLTLTQAGGILQDTQGNEVTELSVSVEAKDPEKTALSYQFGEIVSSLAVNGFGSEKSRSYDISGLDAGRHAFKVDVKDEAGKITSQRVLFEILENKPPRVNSFYVPVKAKAGEEVSLRTSAFDPEGVELRYSWSVTHNGNALTLVNKNASSASFTVGQDLSGEIEVRLEVSDGSNSVVRERRVEIVQNNAPVINQFRVLPTKIKVGGGLQFSAMAADPDLDSVSYRWYLNDEEISQNSSGVLNIATDAQAGAYRLKLVVSDGELSAQQEEIITIEALAAKPVVALQAGKRQILVGTDVAITANVNIPSRLRWSVSEGAEIIPATAGATFSAQNEGIYIVSVIATNEDGIQSDVTTMEIEVKSVDLILSSDDPIQVIGNEFIINAVLSDENFVIPSNAIWSISSKPDGSTTQLTVDGSSVRVTPDIVGSYTISLSFEIDSVSFTETQTITVSEETAINEANSVHGVVIDSSGEILEGVRVRLYNVDDLSLYDMTISTDNKGYYLFSELPAGRYYLVVGGGSNYINQSEVIVIQ